MANAEQLALLKESVAGWNAWRKDKPDKKVDLTEADLRGAFLIKANLNNADLSNANISNIFLWNANLVNANLSNAKLSEVGLRDANLTNANLSGANLTNAYITDAKLISADLSGANLTNADLSGANLTNANLSRAKLIYAKLNGANLLLANLSNADLRGAELAVTNLLQANLNGADLREADLSVSHLVFTKINDAKISSSKVYGVNVWDLEGEFKEQKDLIITPENASPITVDNIKVAQFIYLILNNKELREVINTLTSKTVLILGRFVIPERKAILDRLRDKLREYDLLPIVFDFDRPIDKDFTETIKTLAGISYFVIADVTNPKSSPLELQATIPDYQIPFVPIIQEGEYPFSMMVDLQKKYNWVLDTISYDSLDTLSKILKPHIIDPAIKKHDELRLIKAAEPTIISGRDLLSKK